MSNIDRDNADLLSDTPTPSARDIAVARVIARERDAPTRLWSFAELCDEWIYVAQMARFICTTDTNLILKKSDFDDRFAYCKPDAKGLKTVSAVMFNKAHNTIRRPMRAVYLPGELPGMVGENYNLYVPSSVVSAKGDTEFWNEHLAYLWPDKTDRDLVLNWIAWLLQNPDLKPKHALLLVGRYEGTGKSFIADVLTKIIGNANVSPITGNELSSSFNKWAQAAKLITIEDLDALEKTVVKHKLHPLITQEEITVNDKGITTYTTQNCFGILAMTNKEAALRLANEDRRYLVVRTHAKPRSVSYYNDLYSILDDADAMAAIAAELLVRDVGEYNGQGRAPETQAKREMIEAGQTDLEAWIFDNMHSYPFTLDLVSELLIIELMPDHLAKRPGTRREVRRLLREIFEGQPLKEQLWISADDRPRVWALHGKYEEIARLSNARRVALLMQGRSDAKAVTDQRVNDADLFGDTKK